MDVSVIGTVASSILYPAQCRQSKGTFDFRIPELHIGTNEFLVNFRFVSRITGSLLLQLYREAH